MRAFLIGLGEGCAIGFGVGLVTWGIARGIQNPPKLMFVPLGVLLLLLVHFCRKRRTGRGINWTF